MEKNEGTGGRPIGKLFNRRLRDIKTRYWGYYLTVREKRIIDIYWVHLTQTLCYYKEVEGKNEILH